LSTADANPSLNTNKKIPGLYQTENVPLDDKIIFQRYHIKEIGFYWLISELDTKENLAFGYANLSDDQNAEWGYIDIFELLSNGAIQDRDWKPCRFSEARKRIAEEERSQAHQ
jgi:hypothetical protein